jgi:small conductance mechanosensitive channel
VPIIDRLSKTVVLVVSGLLILIELNVNVMPIVASFSVLGLGIGLASKSIIEDFMNGLLIIQENDFNIGDKVTIGGITGTIENITLRKLHLRDSKGFLNFIPFSNVGAITNQSRDYNNDKITIPLPSAFHLKRTVHILEDVGKQLLHDPELKHYVIAAPKFIGVSEFQVSPHQNSEITTMMQFELKTTPGSMSLVSGEFRKLAKLAFEEMERIMSKNLQSV